MTPLAPDRAALVDVSAAIAARDGSTLASALERARDAVPAEAVEEVLLQSYLFLGFPAALTAMAAWRDLTGPAARAADELAPDGSLDAWTARGQEICRRVYGPSYDRLRENIANAHPALDRWMIAEGYGKVLGRPGLDLATRELCIVALLAVSAREPQLHSHLRGALNAGADREAIGAALGAGLRLVDDARWKERAEDLWKRVRARHEREGAR